jgi:hypothetical protein
MRDFTTKDFLIGLLLCALEIWLLSIGGVIGVAGEILTIPGRLLSWIGSLIVSLAPR